MNRRSFLASLAAAVTLDPERALWVPGAKLISIPKPRALPIEIWMKASAYLDALDALTWPVELQDRMREWANRINSEMYAPLYLQVNAPIKA